MSKRVLVDDDGSSEEFLPDKSRSKYLKHYNNFIATMNLGKRLPHEQHLLQYLRKLADEGKKPKTLWTLMSSIKSVWKSRNGAVEFPKVTAFLKQLDGRGSPAKKAKTFDRELVNQLLTMDVPEGVVPEAFNLNRAFFVVGYFGGLRAKENHSLMKEDLRVDADYGIFITYTPLKQRGAKETSLFLIPKGPAEDAFNMYYMKVNPSREEYLWHCVNYVAKGKANGYQAIRFGINSCYSASKVCLEQPRLNLPHQVVAAWLGLEDTDNYTSHGLRRSSATHAADSGASMEELMRFYNWSSVTVAQGYLDRSKALLAQAASRLAGSSLAPQTSPPPHSRPAQHATPSFVINVGNVSDNAVVNIGLPPQAEAPSGPEA